MSSAISNLLAWRPSVPSETVDVQSLVASALQVPSVFGCEAQTENSLVSGS